LFKEVENIFKGGDLMKCKDIQKRLSAYQDGELGARERDLIAGHLHMVSNMEMRYKVKVLISRFETPRC
jgi:hypothetical protein